MRAESGRVSYNVGVVALSEKSLTEKVLAGERISPEEALELYRRPLAELGQLATARRDLAKAASYDNRGREIVTYIIDRKSTRLNSSHVSISYAVFCLKKKKKKEYRLYIE